MTWIIKIYYGFKIAYEMVTVLFLKYICNKDI